MMMMLMTICKEGSHLLHFSLRWEFIGSMGPQLGYSLWLERSLHSEWGPEDSLLSGWEQGQTLR